MLGLSNILILATAYLVVYCQVSFNGLREYAGVQLDLLPSLMVYASLTHGLPTLALLAVSSGLLVDSLSHNPLGITILPLFILGFILHRFQGLILRDEPFAQWTIGVTASAGTPLCTLVLLLNLEAQPLLSWFSLWQWVVVSLLGAVMTPLWFHWFDRINRALNYRPLGGTSFRPDREIKRSRMLS